jgi:hypothetical protein
VADQSSAIRPSRILLAVSDNGSYSTSEATRELIRQRRMLGDDHPDTSAYNLEVERNVNIVDALGVPHLLPTADLDAAMRTRQTEAHCAATVSCVDGAPLGDPRGQ